MQKRKLKIIVCGESIALDTLLIGSLQEFFNVNIFNNCLELPNIICKVEEKLILWELLRAGQPELNAIKSIKKKRPEIEIVIINGGSGTKIAAEILKAGASDIFPKPFDNELLIDRIVALLSLKDDVKKIE